MNKFIILATLLASTQSYAGQACTAFYASGMSDVFQGEAVQLGEAEKITEGQSSQDTLYTVSVDQGQPNLTETASGKSVKMTSQELAAGVSLHSTKNLKLYPSDVVSSDSEHRLIVVLCSDEKNF